MPDLPPSDRFIIDLRQPSKSPTLDPIPYDGPSALQAQAEHQAKRKYADMMADAQFGPGAIIDTEA